MPRELVEPGAAGEAPESRLESWKEIAAYLNRHVTTVRRWEKHEGLPVHRHVHEKLGSVYAFRRELDDWRRTRRALLEGSGRDEQCRRAESPRVRETWLGAIVEPRRTLGIGGAAVVFALVCACIVWVSLRSEPAALQAPPRSIAILPFKPLVSHGADELLQAGMTEAVITKLSRLSSLRVEPFARVRQYGQRDQDPLAAARALGVDSVLDGYFQQVDDRVHVRARVLRTADGTALATDEWDTTSADILQVQSRIAERVATALELALSPAQHVGVRRQDTQSPEAYEHYLFGRYHLDVRETERMLEAEREFREAIRLDPQYARAYSGLALALLGQAWFNARPGADVVGAARDAALKALALDGSIALAHSALGEIAGVFESDPAKADREHRLAFQLDQRDPWVLRSYTFFRVHTGAFDDALELNRRDLEQEPTSPLANRIKAQILYVARRYDDCVAQSRKTLLLDAHNLTAYGWLALCLEQEGRRGEAVLTFEKLRTIATHTERDDTLMHVYRQRGWNGYWRERLRLEGGAASWLTTADMLVRLGEMNEALQALERGFNAREPMILSGLNHPRWDPLRASPRFQALSLRVR